MSRLEAGAVDEATAPDGLFGWSTRAWWIIAAVVAVAGLVLGIAYATGWRPEDSKCDRYYAERQTHSTADDPFWETLQQCARDGELPDGENNPGYYE